MPIVKRLKGTEFETKFANLVEFAAPILESGPALSSIGFTPHDFTHHVKDMYSLFNKMLPTAFFKKYSKGENLFVLLASALFHDIGMTKEWNDEVRSKHSEIGKEMFLKYFIEGSADSVVKQNIETRYSDYIGDIIYAHSDVKESNGTIFETFRDIYDKYEKQKYGTKGNQEEINVPFLAALVRLADELDITYERIENIDYSKKNNLSSSLEHFKLCELIKDIQLSKSKDSLVIVIDESKCNLELLNQKSSGIDSCQHDDALQLATEAASILERYEKIQKEFRMLNELVLRNTTYASDEIWTIRRIELEHEEKLIAVVKKKRKIVDINGSLTKEVINNNLFKSGHYRLDELHSVRDWIDLDGLFNCGGKALIVDLMSSGYIEKMIKSKKTIIGINHYGAILASLIGYKYGKPFAYVFDGEKIVDTFEREINHIEKDGILLIIDVVVFGDSLCKVLDSMSEKGVIEENNGIDVIVLFERIYKKSKRYKESYNLSKIYSNRFIHEVYVINDSFDVELCKKNREECIFRKGISENICNYESNLVTCQEENEKDFQGKG